MPDSAPKVMHGDSPSRGVGGGQSGLGKRPPPARLESIKPLTTFQTSAYLLEKVYRPEGAAKAILLQQEYVVMLEGIFLIPRDKVLIGRTHHYQDIHGPLHVSR